MADAPDSKSGPRETVWVQVPPSVLREKCQVNGLGFAVFPSGRLPAVVGQSREKPPLAISHAALGRPSWGEVSWSRHDPICTEVQAEFQSRSYNTTATCDESRAAIPPSPEGDGRSGLVVRRSFTSPAVQRVQEIAVNRPWIAPSRAVRSRQREHIMPLRDRFWGCSKNAIPGTNCTACGLR